MNWGKGLIIGMGTFMVFILSLGIKMLSGNKDDYDRQYYEKGLTFDADYRKEKQVIMDNARPEIAISRNGLHLQFKVPAAGNITLMRPANRRLDQQLRFNTDNKGAYLSQLNWPANGRWHIELQWQSGGKQYLYQQQVYVK